MSPDLDPSENDAVEPAAAEDVPPVPLNRAERRAAERRGHKPANTPPPGGRGKVAGRGAPTAGPRNWANRRSG
jgi:hypothetical protein